MLLPSSSPPLISTDFVLYQGGHISVPQGAASQIFNTEGFLTAEATTLYDEAVHAIFLCFLEACQIAILKIAFLSAGPLNASDPYLVHCTVYIPANRGFWLLGTFCYGRPHHWAKVPHLEGGGSAPILGQMT